MISSVTSRLGMLATSQTYLRAVATSITQLPIIYDPDDPQIPITALLDNLGDALLDSNGFYLEGSY